jgi:hypothetical protein
MTTGALYLCLWPRVFAHLARAVSQLEEEVHERMHEMDRIHEELDELRALQRAEAAEERAEQHWSSSSAVKRSAFKRLLTACRHRYMSRHGFAKASASLSLHPG